MILQGTFFKNHTFIINIIFIVCPTMIFYKCISKMLSQVAPMGLTSHIYILGHETLLF